MSKRRNPRCIKTETAMEKLNLCGEKIQLLRKQMTPKVSQRL